MQRRDFILTSSAVGFGSTAMAAAGTPSAPPAPAAGRRPNPIGISSYSIWGFNREDLRALDVCIDHAARMGFDGFEILMRQLASTERGELMKIKRQAFLAGLPLMGYSTHQGFLSPDPEKRAAQVKHTTDCLEQAYQLGIPTMRVNSGTWGTSKSFNELMANRGMETPIDGHTEEDAYGWVISSKIRMTAFASSRRTPSYSRPRPTSAAASGIRSTSTTPGLRRS